MLHNFSFFIRLDARLVIIFIAAHQLKQNFWIFLMKLLCRVEQLINALLPHQPAHI